MTEYSRMVRGHFTSTGAAKAIYLPFTPDYIELENQTASAAFTDQRVLSATWDAGMGQNYALVTVKDTTMKTSAVTSGGFSTFSAGLSLQYGPSQQVVSTTLATSNFEVTGHGYQTGDVVVFQNLYQSATTGSPQIDGMPFVITRIDADNFTINWDMNQSNYTALAASPADASVKKVLYPFLYAPGVAFLSDISTSGVTTFTTTAPHNFVVGQEVAFRMPEEYDAIEFNSLPNSTTPGSPVYYYVKTVPTSTTFTLGQEISYTAFDTNQPVDLVSGLSFPQVVAVGDVNTGGVAYSGGNLYPSPVVNGVSTINGPAISGSFVNNTRQGFIIGAGASTVQAAAILVGASNDVIYWRAYLHDMNVT